MPGSGGGWREPTDALPLRFGTHRGRHVAAALLLVAGGAVVQLGSVYTRELLVAGVVATVAGWVVVPSTGRRRVLATAPGLLGVASLLNGAGSGALVVLALGSWLLVRIRPPRSCVVLPVPVVVAVLLAQVFPQYDARPVVVVVIGATVVGCAWLARSLAASPPWRVRERIIGLFQRRRRPAP